jgi:hypothetical protein
VGHFTPGATEGSHVVAAKEAVPHYNANALKGGLQPAATMRTTREGPQHRDPQVGSSEGTQRGDGRRPERRPSQKAGGSRGGGRHTKHEAGGGSAGGRHRNRAAQQAAVTGGRHEKRAAVTGGRCTLQETCPGAGCPHDIIQCSAVQGAAWCNAAHQHTARRKACINKDPPPPRARC